MAATDPTFIGFGVRDKHGNMLPGVVARELATQTIPQLDFFFKKNAPHTLLELHEPAGSETKLTPINMLRVACGYLQNGSQETVTISQDDATCTFHITVGDAPRPGAADRRRGYWGRSLVEAIEAAYKGEKE